MKHITLKHVVLLYAMIIIGCGVAPDDKTAQYLDDVYNVQFTVLDADHSGGGASASPMDHSGGGAVRPSDHSGGGAVKPDDHSGGGASASPMDHSGGGSIVKGDIKIELKALVEANVDAILVEDKANGSRSIEFKQDEKGNIYASFIVSDMDFKVSLIAGDKEMQVIGGKELQDK